jgi:phosphoribosylformylglycinamidine (FGAM) synthase-like enzyme
LAVAVAEAGFPGNLGAELRLDSAALPAEYVLFGEDASRVVLSCDPEKVGRIQQVALKWGVEADPIGQTTSGQFGIYVDGKVVVSAPVSDLKAAWETALEKALHTDTEERLVPEVLQKS